MSLEASAVDDFDLDTSQETTLVNQKPIKNAAQTDGAQWAKANPDEAIRLLYVQQSTDDTVIDALLETAF
jgi:hypothetical protein